MTPHRGEHESGEYQSFDHRAGQKKPKPGRVWADLDHERRFPSLPGSHVFRFHSRRFIPKVPPRVKVDVHLSGVSVSELTLEATVGWSCFSR